MASNELNKAEFDRTANDAKLWVLRGNDLHLSSRVLREKVTSFKLEESDLSDGDELAKAMKAMPYMGLVFQSAMLQGFSIEVFLKAFWLCRGNHVAQDGEYEIASIKKDNHNLCSIADGVGFEINEEEREVLTRLSLFVSSYGRYPITKKWQQNPLKKDRNGVLCRLSWDNEDHAVAESLIARLGEFIAKS